MQDTLRVVETASAALLVVRFERWARVHSAIWPDAVLQRRVNYAKAADNATHYFLASKLASGVRGLDLVEAYVERRDK